MLSARLCQYGIGRALTNHLLDIDNNKVENVIIPVTIGRKNYMFAGSHEAAQRSAILQTARHLQGKSNILAGGV